MKTNTRAVPHPSPSLQSPDWADGHQPDTEKSLSELLSELVGCQRPGFDATGRVAATGKSLEHFRHWACACFWWARRLDKPIAAWLPSWCRYVPTSSAGLWGAWVRHLHCFCLGHIRTWWTSPVHWVPPGKGMFAFPESLARRGGELQSFVLSDMPAVLVPKCVARRRNEAAGSAQDTITPPAMVILYARDNPAQKTSDELSFSPLSTRRPEYFSMYLLESGSGSERTGTFLEP